MSYSYIELFGILKISFSEEMLILAPSTREIEPGAPKPSLHRGEFADHISIPLKPRADGRSGDGSWIHLTWKDGHHQEVGTLRPEDGKRFGVAMDRFVESKLLSFFSTVQRVDSTWLAERGYQILWYDPQAFSEQAKTAFRVRSRRYRVSEDQLQDLAREQMYVADPHEILDDVDIRSELPESLCAVNENEAQATYRLTYAPEGWMGGDPGWYAWPESISEEQMNDFGRALIDELVQIFGPQLFECIQMVCTELGIPCDYEAVGQVIARAKSLELGAV